MRMANTTTIGTLELLEAAIVFYETAPKGGIEKVVLSSIQPS